MLENKIFGMISLGCDKNRVDAERLLGILRARGLAVTDDIFEANILIVNTCAFLSCARQEAIDAVLDCDAYRGGKLEKIVVSGCLPEKYADELFPALTEADVLLGCNDADALLSSLERSYAEGGRVNAVHAGHEGEGGRVLTTPLHYAYLKIADGCSNHCTYCLIPKIRGKYRSYPEEKLLAEAESLGELSELILVAQDTTKYGVDLYGKCSLVPLLRQLSGIEGIRRLRLLYCYPELTDEQLIREIETNDKIAKYIDIPLQHVNGGMLKAMNRKSTAEGVRRLFDRLQRSQPKIQVRSTFICGFPGETPQTVEEVAEFLKRYKLRNVGFFPYSREEGTVAATMAQQVDGRKKNAYVRKLYGVQQSVVAELLQSDVGKTYLCIVDEPCSDGKYKGRTEFMSPEIDGCVYISSSKRLHAGDFVSVKITDKTDYDLIGEVAE